VHKDEHNYVGLAPRHPNVKNKQLKKKNKKRRKGEEERKGERDSLHNYVWLPGISFVEKDEERI
jgi:hypothetical protein